ncbi:pentapeptide repeat-containing protein [Pseudoroseicyclus tamaricis]|uniref:Pentapeptide repeat-containing protein n=1 Tax=Pseudoroseicyclus tamaricis TaxID=2705421 RepID=A0A6B2JJU5_9RHOB|nr:pentapeptide repeat-containing protein [Pseudoroseicyclus tamaricis]NDV01713.1 pentapeptide repeat-containing protein [Pseudoroseicyclus tamaricis]
MGERGVTLTLPLTERELAVLGLVALVTVVSALVYALYPSIAGESVRKRPVWLSAIIAVAAPLFVLATIAAAVVLWTVAGGQGEADTPATGLGAGALIAALLGAPLVIWRSWVAHRTADVAEENHKTELFNKAIENLGAVRSVIVLSEGEDGTQTFREATEKNKEVRIGAILALTRLSRANDDIHVQVMKILSSYISENARIGQRRDDQDQIDSDVQEALTAIGGRTLRAHAIEGMESHRITLTDCDLSGANFSKLNLSGLNFLRCNFTRARFGFTKAKLAQFEDCKFNEASFFAGEFTNCYFGSCRFKDSMLRSTRIEESSFQHTSFLKVRLDSILLDGSRFFMCSIFESHLDWNMVGKEVSFYNCAFYISDIRSKTISASILSNSFGDASVRARDGAGEIVELPTHWPRFILPKYRFEGEWQKWVDSPETYDPTQAPGASNSS